MNKKGIVAGILVALMIAPTYALEGSMGPARMTLRTEIPFLSQDVGIIEVPIRVANTANEPERVTLFTTDDLNNSDIMTVEFAEEYLVLMPNEERVVDVTITVQKPGVFSGNIVTVFNSLHESRDSVIGSTVGLKLNSKVSIIAVRGNPKILLYSIGALALAGSVVVIVGFWYKKREKEKKRG
jgi:hypothetical protein